MMSVLSAVADPASPGMVPSRSWLCFALDQWYVGTHDHMFVPTLPQGLSPSTDIIVPSRALSWSASALHGRMRETHTAETPRVPVCSAPSWFMRMKE